MKRCLGNVYSSNHIFPSILQWPFIHLNKSRQYLLFPLVTATVTSKLIFILVILEHSIKLHTKFYLSQWPLPFFLKFISAQHHNHLTLPAHPTIIMHNYMYLYAYTCMFEYTNILVQSQAYIHTYTHTHIHKYTCVYVCVCVCAFIQVNERAHVCRCVFVWLCTHICITMLVHL